MVCLLLALYRESAMRAQGWENHGVLFSAQGTALSLDEGVKQTYSTPNRSYLLSLELVRELVPAIKLIARHDGSLAKQLTRALSSVPLNVAEAGGRVGGDRTHLLRIAYGSLREVNACLDTACAFGWLDALPVPTLRDELGALLYSSAQ
jgi:four helix bundle protein